LQNKLIRGNAPVIAYPVGAGHVGYGGVPAAKLARVRAIPGVQTVAPVAYGQGSLASGARPEGLEGTLRSPGSGQFAVRAGQLRAFDGIPGVVLGSDLARRLGIREGEILRLVALGFEGGRPRVRYQSVRVAGRFTTGFAEFDRSYVVMDRGLVERLMGGAAVVDMFEITVTDPAEAPRIAEAVTRVLEPDFFAADWQQLNRELFAALKLQQVALFLVLGLIVLVSTFNVASTLVVLVRERMRD